MTIAVLITRPDPSATALADVLRNRWGCDVRLILSPLLRIEWQGDAPDLEGIGTLIFTSRNGVEAFADVSDCRDISCYAVGPATARLARREGFTVTEAKGDVEALLAQIIAVTPSTPCLHIRGEHSTGDLASRLNAAGIVTRETILYRQIAQPLNDEALACLGRESPVILPLYSPRTAEILFSQSDPLALVLVAAISSNVAAKVPKATVNSVNIASRPDAEAMLEALDNALLQAKLLEGANRAQ